ncbi:MAG: DUF84 family protein [Candidatus Odinarchaeota archaeon]
MIVAITSLNPVKARATREIFRKIFPDQNFDFRAVKVESGVSVTPASDEEMIQGAYNRCKRGLEVLNRQNIQVDFMVGIEGGLDTINTIGTFLKCWCVVMSRTGQIGYGQSPGIQLPEPFFKGLEKNVEFADIAAEISNVEDIRSKEGVFGYLTNHRITRRLAFHAALTTALVPFYNEEAFRTS